MRPGRSDCYGDAAGLDGKSRRLVFFRPSPEARRNIKVPMGTLLRQGCLSIRTDLQDNHLYVLDRSALALLQAKPALADIKQVRPITVPSTTAAPIRDLTEWWRCTSAVDV